jgi:cytochrome c-type biogenesis protein
MGLLQQADWDVFMRSETWKALGVAVIMFGTIAFAGLTLFDSFDEIFESDADPAPIPHIIIDSLNRTGVESVIADENGQINLTSLRGDVIILDLMAHDCSQCHAVQEHLESNIDDWRETAEKNGVGFHIIAYGAWYIEDLEYLNTSTPPEANVDTPYVVPKYPTGLGSTNAAILADGSTTDPVRLFTTAGTGQIPVVMVIDVEGYIVERQATGSPINGWGEFDATVEDALTGDPEVTFSNRLAWEEPSTSFIAVFVLGMILSILVYFSPCAFPVLPGFISYYLSLGAREDELIEEGKLKTKMPSSWVIGTLAGLGMWTFFILIGILAFAMGEAFAKSGLIHYIAIGIALLLVILGTIMLLGITSHLLGFVQKLVDRWSTTEMDETFTPRRNMYLYGIGYAAASIDCTAAAVLPFVIFLGTLGTSAVISGLSGLMIGLLILMIIVTVLVGLGRQVMINFLRRMTGMIKLVGSWMMIMAGIGLTIYLTQPEVVSSVFA